MKSLAKAKLRSLKDKQLAAEAKVEIEEVTDSKVEGKKLKIKK